MIKYRLATSKDSGGIAELLQKRYGRHYKPVRFTAKFVKERLKRKEVFYVIAIDKKRIFGVIRATIVDLDLAELRHEVFPNSGIALGLVREVLMVLRKKRMRKVVARTIATEKLENQLYKRMGFRKEGFFRDHYRKGTNIIQYARFLR